MMMRKPEVNNEDCFANKGLRYCSILTSKTCSGCNFYKTIEKYRVDRLKYKDKEMAYLKEHGIPYREDF